MKNITSQGRAMQLQRAGRAVMLQTIHVDSLGRKWRAVYRRDIGRTEFYRVYS